MRFQVRITNVKRFAIVTACMFLNILTGWIALYGVPERVTTDLGRQFESNLFKELTKTLGIHHLRTAAYHPQANGMIERWHRTLKNAIRCYATKDWSFVLPLVLLGLRTTVKLDIGASPAELLYGAQLRLPGEFWTHSKREDSQTEFVQKLRRAMSELRSPNQSWHSSKNFFVDPNLANCKFVFVRVDRVRKPLEPAFEGPFEVAKRYTKYFVVKRGKKGDKISIDRLKPAKVFSNETHESSKKQEVHPVADEVPGTEKESSMPVVTRYGRRVKFPNYYK